MIQAKRLYELDVLRGLAALGVVLFHYTSNGNGPVAAHTAEYWYNFSIGWLALIIFFSLLKEYYSFQMPGRIAIVLLLDHGMFFIAGIGFYLIYKQGFKLLPSIIVGLSLLSYIIHKSHGHPQIITFFIIFTLVVAGKIQRISIPPLVFLGTISYSLYLIHGSVGGFVIQYLRYTLGMNINLVLLFAVSASIIVAWAITFGIEKPAMAAIKQFYLKRNNYSSV